MSTKRTVFDVCQPDPLWLLHNFTNKYKHIRVPTHTGWTPDNVNGAVMYDPLFIRVNTSVTASSRGLANLVTFEFNSGGMTNQFIDWTKQLELSFILMRQNSDVEVVARFQLKEAATEGALAAKGIGLQISDLTVVGEAYGTALQTTGTLKTLTSRYITRVKIVVTSSSVEFWVDGVLMGVLTGTAVPNVASVMSGYFVISIINGVTGGVNALLSIGNIEVVQAW